MAESRFLVQQPSNPTSQAFLPARERGEGTFLGDTTHHKEAPPMANSATYRHLSRARDGDYRRDRRLIASRSQVR